MTDALTPNERQVLGTQLLEGRDQWAKRGRAALAEYFNNRLIELDDEATARRAEVDELERLVLDMPSVPGVAEIIDD